MGSFIAIIAGGIGAYMIAPCAAAMASAQAQAAAQRMQIEASRHLLSKTSGDKDE